jgi:hypothetical protein
VSFDVQTEETAKRHFSFRTFLHPSHTPGKEQKDFRTLSLFSHLFAIKKKRQENTAIKQKKQQSAISIFAFS